MFFCLSKGSTLTIVNSDKEEFWFYCFAQNVMEPTFEDAVTPQPVSNVRHVTTIAHQGKAKIIISEKIAKHFHYSVSESDLSNMEMQRTVTFFCYYNIIRHPAV